MAHSNYLVLLPMNQQYLSFNLHYLLLVVEVLLYNCAHASEYFFGDLLNTVERRNQYQYRYRLIGS